MNNDRACDSNLGASGNGHLGLSTKMVGQVHDIRASSEQSDELGNSIDASGKVIPFDRVLNDFGFERERSWVHKVPTAHTHCRSSSIYRDWVRRVGISNTPVRGRADMDVSVSLGG
jgi:hypothetical protein